MRSKPTWIMAILLALAVPVGVEAKRAAVCDSKGLQAAYGLFCDEISGGQACLSNQEDGYQWLKLEKYCAGNGAGKPSCLSFATLKEACEPLVLVYDHPTGLWSPRQSGRLAETRVVKDVAGKPTVSLGNEEELWVVVENTNPLLFALTEGTPTEADVPELAQLKKLAGLLGGGIQALIRSQAFSGAPLQDYRRALRARLTPLGEQLELLDCEISRAGLQATRLAAFAQAIESGKDPSSTYSFHPGNCGPAGSPVRVEPLEAVFEKLAGFATQGSCLPALQEALKVYTVDTSKMHEITAAITSYEVLVASPDCVDLSADDRIVLTTDFGQVTQLIANNDEPGLKTLLAALPDRRRALAEAVQLATQESAWLTESATVLKLRDSARTTLSQVIALEERVDASRLAPRGSGIAVKDIDRRLIVDSPARVLHIDKIQSRSIKLAVREPFAKTVAPARPAPVESGFALDSLLRSLWGVGASVTWTPLKSPTFTAVDEVTDQGTQKVIAVADEETRAGKLALLLNYRLGRRLAPTGNWFQRAWGIEFGAAADTAAPGFFGGLSLQLGKYVRLGGGATYQQIKDLRHPQDPGDPVAAATDIKTRDRFELKHYFSLSIAIESISLFQVN